MPIVIAGEQLEGVLKQMYLEENILKLLALQLVDRERIHQAQDILTKNLHQPPPLLDLARQVGLNDYKLKREFREIFGTTGYVQSLRLVEAKRLLAERKLNIATIAHTVGYVSQSHFSYLFKREFGVTPKEYQGSLWL
jgi:AraC family transcriptional regulator, transcriptional activator of the genes for pyochelin and ferripyochelin receptors